MCNVINKLFFWSGKMGPAMAVLVGLALSSTAWGAAGKSNFVPGELLVKAKAGVSQATLDTLLHGNAASELEELPQLKIKRIKVPEQALAQVKAALAKNKNIEFVEENFIAEAAAVPNDTSYASQWHLPKIAAPQGWDIATGSSNVIIAILDTGVDPAHPDLAGQLIPGYNFYANNTDTHDVYGHGTSVAGSAAATGNNALGVTGVAWNNPIMPLVISDATGYATYSRMASAMTYAVDHGAKVINISFAGTSSSSTLQNAANYAWNKGAIVTAGTGNNSTSTPYYPAACTNVLAVGATTSSDTLASFSNFGSWVDVVAPGYSIYTTANGGGYRSASGTSFSGPITAGLAGLVWAANPALTNADVVDILTKSADDLGTAGFDNTFGYGRINAYKALTLAKSYRPAVDTTAPSVAITAPADGVTVTGQVSVSVSASDDTKVTRVELFVDGALVGAASSAPSSFAWDTTRYADKWYTLTATGYDAAGNVGESLSTSVYVSNPEPDQDLEPPVVTITSPTAGTRLASKTTVTVTGSDNVGVVKMELYVDGTLKATTSGSKLSWNWNTRKEKTGAHLIAAKAYDAAGNVMSDSITVYK